MSLHWQIHHKEVANVLRTILSPRTDGLVRAA